MHLKDLDIDVPYRTTDATYSKYLSSFLVKIMQFIEAFKIYQYSFWSKQLLSKRRILVIQESMSILVLCRTNVFYWVQTGASFICEIVIGKKVMRCCFNVFPQMQSRFNVSWKLCEFMIKQTTERTRYKGPSNRIFCNINLLGIDFQLICCQCTLSLPPESIRKFDGFSIFSGRREKVHWE